MATHTTEEIEQQKVFAVLMSEHREMRRALAALNGMPERVKNIEDDIHEIRDSLRSAVKWAFGLIGTMIVTTLSGVAIYILTH